MAHESTINAGSRRSSSSRSHSRRSSSSSGGGAIEVFNVDETAALLDSLKTDRNIGKDLKRIIADAIRIVRRETSKDAKKEMDADPRQAYRAVRSSVYRKIFGGQVNIISPHKAGKTRVSVQYQRTLKPGQLGGNRRQISERSAKMAGYFGADRGFILRFLNEGVTDRKLRNFQTHKDIKKPHSRGGKSDYAHRNTGMRGSISARDWFRVSSEQHTQKACEMIAQNIDLAIQHLWNQG